MAASRFSLALLVSVVSLIGAPCDAAEAGDREAFIKSNPILYSCTINYWQLPLSDVRLELRYLLPRGQLKNSTRTANSTSERPVNLASSEDEEFDKVELKRLPPNASLKELEASGIDPNLPFIFFINGFNQGTINAPDNWMFQVGKTMARFRLRSKNGSDLRANVVFLSWYVENLFVTNVLHLVPNYYKTMANYEFILNYIADSVMHLIDYVDYIRNKRGIEQSQEGRQSYYSQFEFYGHSLGAHLISDAIVKLRSFRPDIRFGKLVGLDPAIPCFSSSMHGISATKTLHAVKEVSIIHSNAAFAGVTSNRAKYEIVLNGGTFQPSCAWLDFQCHHTRSTDIFSFIDDECQMVAYKCGKYEQFKYGACETDDQHTQSSDYLANYLLVLLPEQHVDNTEILESIEDHGHNNPVRQTASSIPASSGTEEEPQAGGEERLSIIKSRIRRLNCSLRSKQSANHYVNTNPNFRVEPDTHCIQHYQLRLLTMNSENQTSSLNNKCRLSSYYGDSSGPKVRLYFGDADYGNLEPLNFLRDEDNQLDNRTYSDRQAQISGEFQKNLMNIIDGRLHSGLVTFTGKPVIITQAKLENIDFGLWSNCLVAKDMTNPIDFVLDVAFMSHLKRGVRQAYSSVLCGQWIPNVHTKSKELSLNLCQRSRLTDVSFKIDQLLSQIEFDNQYETWQVSLLNSLFSLFLNWEPFRRDAHKQLNLGGETSQDM